MAEELDQNPIDAIAEEFAARCRVGAQPTVEEYVKRYPELAEEIRALLPTVAMMEQLKHQKRPPSSNPPSSSTKPTAIRPRPAFRELGDYKILREIGRGGMGIVYEAEEKSLGRRVAVKVLQMQALQDPVRLERFQREAQAAARLHHPNIVPVFGVGECDGTHYFAMQYIPGCGLNDVLKSMKKDLNIASLGTGSGSAVPLVPYTRARHYWRWVAHIGIQVAEALAYAHEQGTLHRDIKPANILLDSAGIAWVADFGLAKVSDHSELTQTGEVIGTIHYMAPEALHGKGDARSDVYGLALTLYELITLQSPFGAFSAVELLKKLDEHEPIRPRQLNPAIPADLETIVLKGSARNPDDRYQNAREFASDLRRFVEDLPIAARQISNVERFRRWCVRNRKIAALSGTAVASLLCALVVGWVGYVKTNEALERESRRREDADAANRRAEGNVQMSLQAFEEIFNEIGDSGPLRMPPPPQQPNGRQNFVPPRESHENAALIQSILRFYEHFAAENATNSRLQLDAARAYSKVGELYLRLSDLDKAENAYRRTVELSATLAPEAGEERTIEELNSQAHFGLGSVLFQKRSLQDAERELQLAIGLQQKIVQREPNSPGEANALASQRHTMAELYSATERLPEAIQLLNESIATLESSLAQNRDRRVQPVLANEYRTLAKFLAQTGDTKAADTAARKADAISPPPPMYARNRPDRDGRFPPPPPDRDGFQRPDRPPPDFNGNDRPPPPDFDRNGPPPERRGDFNRPNRPPPPNAEGFDLPPDRPERPPQR